MIRNDVVVMFEARSDAAALVAAGVQLARERGRRLHVISVVSPWRNLLQSLGTLAPYPGPSPEELDEELARELRRLLAAVPPDVPVCSQLERRSRRRAHRRVGALEPDVILTSRGQSLQSETNDLVRSRRRRSGLRRIVSSASRAGFWGQISTLRSK